MPGASSRIQDYASQAVNSFSAPANRPALQATWERGLRALLGYAEPQRRPAADLRAIVCRGGAQRGCSGRPRGDARRHALLRRTRDGPDLRWALITGLARRGRAGTRIEDELAGDNTISGQEHAAAARSRPVRPPKPRPLRGMRRSVRSDTPNETHRSIAAAFQAGGQGRRPGAVRCRATSKPPRPRGEHLGTHRQPPRSP